MGSGVKSSRREKRDQLVRVVKKRKDRIAREYGNLRRPGITALDIAIQLRMISINANNKFRALFDSEIHSSYDCLLSMLDYLSCSLSLLLPLINRLPVFKQLEKDMPIDKSILQEGLDDIAFILPDEPSWSNERSDV